MRFQAAHKLMTYLLATSALATIASTGALDAATALAFLTLAGASWFADAGGRGAALVDRLVLPARVVVGAVVAATAWLVARRAPDPDLLPVLQLVLLLLAFKLFHRRGNRDDVHIFVLAFLLVIAAGALGGSVLFALAFVVYVLIATWALLLFHLRREMEENYLVKHSAQAPSQKVGVARILNSRRIVGGSFFGATGAVAFGVAVGAAATFALVPRVGAGLVFGPRASGNVIGFSDDVTLGQYGTLGPGSRAVALRATVPRIAALRTTAAREAATDSLYWRGTVYDAYEGGHWTRGRAPALRTVLVEHGGRFVVGAPHGEGVPGRPHPLATVLERQEIDVVGLTTPVAFALDRPVAFEAVGPEAGGAGDVQLLPRWSGEVALRLAPPGSPAVGDVLEETRADPRAPPGLRYVAYSAEAGPGAPAAGAAPSNEARAAYLQVPPALAARLAALVARVAPAHETPARRADALATWLRATHSYSLHLPRPAPGLDPVESFLFELPTGHCEYFATAMTLLLRAAGIPARYVNGYLGGEWNDVGHYVAVRDGRAHSWVEAYLADAGWTRLDPTPPLPAAGRVGELRQLLDSLDLQWTRWVVAYDLSRQLDLARHFAKRLGLHGPDAPGRGRVPGLVVVLAAVAAMALAVARLLPARAGGRPPRPAARAAKGAPVTRLYERALASLAQAGFPRARAETPREFAKRAAAAGLDGESALSELTELYAAARFGRRDTPADELRRLAPAVSRLGRQARATAA